MAADVLALIEDQVEAVLDDPDAGTGWKRPAPPASSPGCAQSHRGRQPRRPAQGARNGPQDPDGNANHEHQRHRPALRPADPGEGIPLLVAAQALWGRGGGRAADGLGPPRHVPDGRLPRPVTGRPNADLGHARRAARPGSLLLENVGYLGLLEAGTFAGDKGGIESLDRTIRLTAYLFVTRLDAWRRFGDETHIDGGALMRRLPAYQSVEDAEPVARHLAWREDAAAEYVAARHPDGPPVVTERTATDELHRLLNVLRGR